MSLKNKTFTDEQFIEAVKNNHSKAGTLRSLSLTPNGNFYKIFDILIKKLDVNTEHFTGRDYLKGKINSKTKKTELSKLLVFGSKYNNYRLNKRLINEGIFKDACFRCGISEWEGEKLSLHLDHINGNHIDNRIENLRLLCPNCHSLTPTYCGKNKNKAIKRNCSDCGTKISQMATKCKLCAIKTRKKSIKIANNCLDCGKAISSESTRCKPCAGKVKNPTKIQWPSTEDLIKMVESSSYLAIGRKLGVSDNAIRQRIKRHPIKI